LQHPKKASDTIPVRGWLALSHGTTTLFAVLNVLNGAVLVSYQPCHWHQEFLSFLRNIDQFVPNELDVNNIVDNCATHASPGGQRLAGETATLAQALHPDL
jgi:hypothetical protein